MQRTVSIVVSLLSFAFALLAAQRSFAEDTPSASALLTGRVVDKENGAPMEGASVRIFAADQRTGCSSFDILGSYELESLAMALAGKEPLCNLATDKDGRFKAQVPGGQEYLVYVLSPNHAHVGKGVAFDQKTSSIECNFALGKPITMKGMVRSEAGEPIQGATVVAFAQLTLWQPLCSAATDKEGRFKIENLPYSPLRAFAVAEGYAPGVRQTIRPSSPRPIFHLQKLGRLRVTVRKPDGTQAKEHDATIISRLRGAQVDITKRLSLKKTGDGVFEAEIAPGEYDLVCVGRGFAPSETRSFLVEPGCLVEREVVLREGHEVRGRIVSKAGGKPVAGATVRVLDPRCSLSARTDTKGDFLLCGMPAGHVALDVVGSDCARRVLPGLIVPKGKPLDIGNIEVAAPSFIKGYVKDERGQALAGWRVLLLGPMARRDGNITDKDGRFCFDGLETGRYYVSAGGEDFGAMRSIVVELSREGDSVETQIAVWTAGSSEEEAKRALDEKYPYHCYPLATRLAVYEYDFPEGKAGAEYRGFSMFFSDEYGLIKMPELKPDTYVVQQVSDYGFLLMTALKVPPPGKRGFDGGLVNIRGSAELSAAPDLICGTVVCEGKGMPNVEVQAYAARQEPTSDGKQKAIRYTQQAISGTNGAFVLISILPTVASSAEEPVFRVVASRLGYVCEPVQLTYQEVIKIVCAQRKDAEEIKGIREESFLKLELRRATTGTLTVKANDRHGLPARALVVLRDADGKTLGMSTYTDQSGIAYFQALKPAVYVIYIEGEGANAKCIERKITVERDMGAMAEVVLE
jgi:protocatechuate 3,4-dioxygenase beta subunit